MTANELFQAGRLTEAIAKVGEEIKISPGDQRARIFLFELLCFSGDLVRAGKQLDAITGDEVDAEITVARYRNLLAAEQVRREVFSGKARPKITEPVPVYSAAHVQALKLVLDGNPALAVPLLEEAQQLREPVRGRVDGETFEDFQDCDDLIGPFLEAIMQGEYCWVPWESIRSLSISPPRYLRDLCWVPAQLELHSAPAGETYLPVLYSGSYLDSDDLVRLGRATDWRTQNAGISLGVGQRLFAAGERDRAILEIRRLEFDDADPGTSVG